MKSDMANKMNFQIWNKSVSLKSSGATIPEGVARAFSLINTREQQEKCLLELNGILAERIEREAASVLQTPPGASA